MPGRSDVVSVALAATSSLLVATRAPEFARKIRQKVTLFGTAVLGGTIVYGIIYFFPVLWPEIALLGGIAIVHNATAFATGLLVIAYTIYDRRICKKAKARNANN